ncbi:MAG: hypothetical protein COA95_04160 [Methylophaga sp.]|nr:MAG: hypothetical protein COA95_04160 [Methylophaga sp.]
MKSIGKLFLAGLMVVVLRSVIQVIKVSAEEVLRFILTAALLEKITTNFIMNRLVLVYTAFYRTPKDGKHQ